MFCGGLEIKPCVVLLEKWIASQENANGILSHDVDSSGICETSRHGTSIGADNESINMNQGLKTNDGNSSLHGSSNESLKESTMDDIQQLIDSTKSERESSQSVLHSRIASIIQKGQFSEEHYKVVVENDVEQGRNLILLKTLHKIPQQSSAAASTSSIFELGHALYEEMANEIRIQDYLKNTEMISALEYERPTGEETYEQNNDTVLYNCNRAISEDISQQNSPTYDVHASLQTDSQSNHDLHCGDRTDYRSNVECPEYMQDEPEYQSSQISLEEDYNEPIDYSMSFRYYESNDSTLDFTKKNSTHVSTEGRFSYSPATGFHLGFGRTVHQDSTCYQSAEQFYVDQRQETTGISPNFGDPQISAFKRVSSYYPAAHLETEYLNLPGYIDAEEEHATNGIFEHTPADTAIPVLDTADTESQTEDDKDDRSQDPTSTNEPHLMNNNVNLLLMHFLCNWMSTFNSFTSSVASNAAQPTNNNISNSQNVAPPTKDDPDISNEDTISQSIHTNTENISDGNRKKNSKKIPPRRSKRLSEMTLKNVKMIKETIVAPKPPKRMKRPKFGEVNNEFEVENLQITQNKLADDDWLEVVPRKINFQENRFNHCGIPPTPKRLSKYMRKVRLSKLRKL